MLTSTLTHALCLLLAQSPIPDDAPSDTSPLVEPTPAAVADPAAAGVNEAAAPPATTARQALTVVDSASGATPAGFAGVLVLIDGDLAGTTDGEGHLVLEKLAPGPHLLSLAGPQGEELHEPLVLPAGVSLARSFRLAAHEGESLRITQKVARPRREPGEVLLSQSEVTGVPGTLGDPVRVIENLPGASRAPGGMGGALIIRGANPADSGVLLDGVQIPLLYHFGGLTSVISSEFLSAITFMPGGFGAEHGRATGGVASVQSATLACDKLRASASVDLMDAELFTCVPLGRWKLAGAARRSYIDAFLPSLLEGSAEEGKSATIVSPVYYDYQLKAETTPSTRHRFEIFAFGSHDHLKVTQATSAGNSDLDLGGTIAFHRLQLRHIFLADGFTLESALTPGVLSHAIHESSQDRGSDEQSGLTMYTLQWRETASLRLGDRITLRGGLDHLLSRWSADFLTPLPTTARRYPSPIDVDVHTRNTWHHKTIGLDQAYWAEALWKPTERVTVTPGLRVANLVFDQSQRLVFEPRLGARWQASDDTAFTAATGIYRKLPDMFSGVMVADFGQPNLDAERALHVVGGIEQRLGPFATKLEGFHVRRDKLPSPTTEMEVKDGRAVPVLFRSDGRSRSYGVELMLRLPERQESRFSGWMAYTLSRSFRRDRMGNATGGDQYAPIDPSTPRLAELSAEREYLSPFDQTHVLTTVGRWQLPWKMSLGFRFQLVSGNPTTPLERGESYYDADSDRYQVRPGSVAAGSGRLPTFHRLDLRFDKRWDFDSWKLTAYLELMNAYNKRPVESYDYDYRFRTRNELLGLPVLPLLGIKGEI
jgi:hypothetical protein